MMPTDTMTPAQIRTEYERLDRLDRLFMPVANFFDRLARFARRYGMQAEEFLAQHDSACHGNCIGCGTPLLTGDWVSHFFADETLCQACAPTLAEELATLETYEKEGLYADDPEQQQALVAGIAELRSKRDDGIDMAKKELWQL